MAINLEDGFLEVLRHWGHHIQIDTYGDRVNVAIACHTCNEILLDFDRPDHITAEQADAAFYQGRL